MKEMIQHHGSIPTIGQKKHIEVNLMKKTRYDFERKQKVFLWARCVVPNFYLDLQKMR